ncbi:hypothetical protein vseg_010622 [Gypsophila vaccaria]
MIKHVICNLIVAMELKHGVFAMLIVYVLVAPYTSSVRARELVEIVRNEDIYEIDYKGPETHSHLPPPKLGKGPFIHDQIGDARATTNNFQGNNGN